MKFLKLAVIICFVTFSAFSAWKPNTSDNLYTGKNDFEKVVDMDAGLGVSGDSIHENLYFGTYAERMKFPTTRGTIGQLMYLDTNGVLIWSDPTGGSSSEVTWQGSDGAASKGNRVKFTNGTVTKTGALGTVEITIQGGGGGTGEVTWTGKDNVSKTGNLVKFNNVTFTKTGSTTEATIAHNDLNSVSGSSAGYHLDLSGWLKVVSDSFSSLLVTNDLTVKNDVLVSGEVRISGKVKALTLEGNGEALTNVLHSYSETSNLNDTVTRNNITGLNIIAGGIKATTGDITTFVVSEVRAFNDISTDKTLVCKQIITPGVPSAGYTKLYSKADGKFYYMTADTGETPISTGSGGGTSYISGDGISISGSTISNNIDTTSGGLKFDTSSPKKVLINPLYGLEIVSNYLRIAQGKGVAFDENNKLKVALGEGLQFNATDSIEVKLNGSTLSRSASGLSVTTPWTGTSEIFVAGSNGVGRKGDKLKFTNGTVTRSGNTVEVTISSSASDITIAGSNGVAKTGQKLKFTNGTVTQPLGAGTTIEITTTTPNDISLNAVTANYISVNYVKLQEQASTDFVEYPSGSSEVFLYYAKEIDRPCIITQNKDIYKINLTYWRNINPVNVVVLDATQNSSTDFAETSVWTSSGTPTVSATSVSTSSSVIRHYKTSSLTNEKIIVVAKIIAGSGRIGFGIAKAPTSNYAFAINSTGTGQNLATIEKNNQTYYIHYYLSGGTADLAGTGVSTSSDTYCRIEMYNYTGTTYDLKYWITTTPKTWDSDWGSATGTYTGCSCPSGAYYIGVGSYENAGEVTNLYCYYQQQ